MKNNYTRREQTDGPAPAKRKRDDEPPRERRTRMPKKESAPSGKFNIVKNPKSATRDQQPPARRGRPASSESGRSRYSDDKPRDSRGGRSSASSFGSSRRSDSKPSETRRERPSSSFSERNERFSDKPREERRARPSTSSFGRSERFSDKPREERRGRPASTSYDRPSRKIDSPREERRERPASNFSRTRSTEDKPFTPARRTTSGTRSFSSSERPTPVKKSYSERSERSTSGYSGSFTDDKKPRSGRKRATPGASDVMRLNRFISNAGICSRRDADKWITAGMVTVNGNTVTELGTKVSVSDDVRFDGQKLNPERKVYVLLNKPKDFVTTTDDPHAEHTVMELVKTACNERIYPVGRLDKNTTGLLLFTNDGELSKKLTHPSHNIKKIYQVTLDKDLTKDDLQKISEGIELEDGLIAADAISYVDMGDKTEIGIEIHSGRNRVVRRMFEHLGYRVRKLDRVYFAGLTKKNIPRGKYRVLTEKEVRFLKMN